MSEATGEPLIEVRDLVKHFPITRGIIFQKKIGAVKAVDGISFDVHRGETLGIVGESGCGKSTTARLLVKLLEATSGEIRFDGRDLTQLRGAELKQMRREMQMIFQDPYSSLNPRKTVGSIIGEPFSIHNMLPGKDERKKGVQDLMETRRPEPRALQPLSARVLRRPAPAHRCRARARARPEAADRRRARLGTRRLDPGPGAQPAARPAGRLGLTVVFIAHDLSVVRHMCDRVAVMYLGKIVEFGPGGALYEFPRHPYTGALLSAVPVVDPHRGTAANANC